MSTTPSSRTFTAVLQVTLDGFILGPEGEVDWVDSWADGLNLLGEVDAFVLGGGMFPDYEDFWTAVIDDPASVTEWIGREPYEREISYARVAAATPHLVLSPTLTQTTWPSARIAGPIGAPATSREQPAKPVSVVGGPGLATSLLYHGPLDEL